MNTEPPQWQWGRLTTRRSPTIATDRSRSARMRRFLWQRRIRLALLTLVTVGITACGAGVTSQVRAVKPSSAATAAASILDPTPAPPATFAQTAPVEDPVLALIAASERHFKAGQTAL